MDKHMILHAAKMDINYNTVLTHTLSVHFKNTLRLSAGVKFATFSPYLPPFSQAGQLRHSA